jgi:hypothetical protein
VARLLPIVLTLLALLGSPGCEESVTRTDSRFATPERTVETLLATYGLEDVPQEEIRTRMAERGAFELRDRETWRQCFVDLSRPGGEGMAGYVLGVLAAARDDLRYETVEEHGYVIPRDDIRIVMERDETGAYRIVLAESVPEEVQRGLLQIEENARHRIPRDPAP